MRVREREARMQTIIARTRAGETLGAIGRDLGITKERVRQLLVKAGESSRGRFLHAEQRRARLIVQRIRPWARKAFDAAQAAGYLVSANMKGRGYACTFQIGECISACSKRAAQPAAAAPGVGTISGRTAPTPAPF